jgi:hypothetical protein
LEISAEQNLEDISKVNITAEELEGFLIVKTILGQNIPATRITYRDSQSYFAIFLDDTNRKVIPFRLIKQSNLYSLSYREGWIRTNKKTILNSNWYNFLLFLINYLVAEPPGY